MEESVLLGLGVLVAGAIVVVSVLYYEMAWKAKRRRRIERDHARNKVR